MIINPYEFGAAGPPPSSTFPQVSDADTKTGTQSSSASTWTLDYPTNLAAGDLILVFMTSTGWAWDGAISGFTNLMGRVGGGPVFFVFGKVAAGTESGTFTLAFDTSGTGVWRTIRIPAASWYGGTLASGQSYSGHVYNESDGLKIGLTWSPPSDANPDPPDAGSGAAGGPLYPPRDLPWGTLDYLFLAVAMWSGDTTTVNAFPTSYGSTAEQEGGGLGIAIARRELNTLTEDPGAFTLSAVPWFRAPYTITIRPA